MEGVAARPRSSRAAMRMARAISQAYPSRGRGDQRGGLCPAGLESLTHCVRKTRRDTQEVVPALRRRERMAMLDKTASKGVEQVNLPPGKPSLACVLDTVGVHVVELLPREHGFKGSAPHDHE